MPDTTYRDSAQAQIDGSLKISYELKEDLHAILNKLTETEIESIARSDGKGRFFYTASADDIARAMINGLPQGRRNKYQAEVNAAARAGTTHSNKFIADNFSSNYTKAGHKYVNGRRIY